MFSYNIFVVTAYFPIQRANFVQAIDKKQRKLKAVIALNFFLKRPLEENFLCKTITQDSWEIVKQKFT